MKQPLAEGGGGQADRLVLMPFFQDHSKAGICWRLSRAGSERCVYLVAIMLSQYL